MLVGVSEPEMPVTKISVPTVGGLSIQRSKPSASCSLLASVTFMVMMLGAWGTRELSTIVKEEARPCVGFRV